jgi:DNA (cytosine-5)-methyltransferase 1
MAQLNDNTEETYVVRRITPVEAERLQGFPDNYTNIEYNGKPAPDSLRYKCLGNSFSVNVVKWIAQRILDVEKEGEDEQNI